jgi:hypothetical protein
VRAILDKGRSPGEFLPDIPDVPVRFDKGPGKMDGTPDFRPQEPQGKAMAPYQPSPMRPTSQGARPIGNYFFCRAHGRGTFSFRSLCFRRRIDLPDITDPAMPAAAASGCRSPSVY